LITDAGLPFTARWGDWRDVESPADVVAYVTVRDPISDEMFDRFPNARVILVAFTGYDSIDLDACRQRGVAVYNVPHYSTDSVAELTIALTICLLRDIPRRDQRLREGIWKSERWATELAGKTVGIVGTGAIGLRAAELFKAFKCRLLGWSRTQRPAFTDLGGEYVSWDGLFSRSDIVSLHVPLNSGTEHLVDSKALGLMRRGACLINTARGKIVDKAALVRALEDGHIRAALDVFDKEPIPHDDPLFGPGNTLLTPHIAFKTNEALLRRARVTVGNIKSFLEGSPENRIV
jgi:D-3-phosphoglycerate dehydrogenase